MSNKYIIKACPNLTTSYYGTGETIHNQCGLTDDDLCANCTHCVMKQIVKLCKKEKTINCNIDGKEQVLKAYYHTHLGDKILELLDIEECE